MIIQPPNNFLPAEGVIAARMCSVPQFATRNRYIGKRKKGVEYEAKVHEYLKLLDENYVPGFWLSFVCSDAPKWRYCQPDGLRFDFQNGIITLVEIKYQHTPDAWFQVKQLYYPVLRAVFPAHLWRFDFCEVVKWYDPARAFPEPVRLVANPFTPADIFKVHIWRP